MGKIKIVQIITRLDKGGSAKILLELSRNLNKSKFDLKIISGLTKNPQEDLDKFTKDTGIEIIFVKSLQRNISIFLDIISLYRLYLLLKKYKPDIVHAHTSKAGFLGRLAARLAGVRIIIYMPHGHIFYGYANCPVTYLFIILERFAAKFTTRVVTITNIEKQEFIKRRIGTEDKFVTIHNGLDLKNYQAIDVNGLLALKDNLQIQPGISVISVISRLEPVKGIDIFIRALVGVNKVFPSFLALIVGDGSLKEQLKTLSKDLNLDSKILFLGFLKNVRDIIYLSDLVVNPARNEGLGLAIIEAGALGKTVVATRVGGVPEVVEDNKTGILVESKNPESLALGIIRVLQNKEFAQGLGQKAKEKVSKEFSQDKMISEFEKLYLSLSGK
jgi:glycosyltransferase involved in cell wall biosynthesis